MGDHLFRGCVSGEQNFIALDLRSSAVAEAGRFRERVGEMLDIVLASIAPLGRNLFKLEMVIPAARHAMGYIPQ